jgi:MoaA/NifB/PqqE/SkfB family radical SAM enzyme
MENDQRLGKIKETPFSLDVKFTNACNLKCVICSPMNSSQWYSDFEFLYPGAFNNAAYKWISQIDILEKLKNYLHTAEILEFYGGEPLSLKYYNNILKYCVDNNISENKKIRTNTNGTIWVSDELLNYYSKFDYVGLQWSIDSLVREEFEYQRFPAKFDSVMNNIENVLAKCPPSVNIGITYTVSALNIFSIHSMIDFVRKNNIWFHLNVLSGPDFLRFNTLPKKLINDYLDSIDVTDVKFTTITLDNLKNYDSEDDCTKMNTQLKTYLTKLDSRRNTSYKDTFGILGSILNDI